MLEICKQYYYFLTFTAYIDDEGVTFLVARFDIYYQYMVCVYIF